MSLTKRILVQNIQSELDVLEPLTKREACISGTPMVPINIYTIRALVALLKGVREELQETND